MNISKLLKEIASYGECAFRRGYQHGYHAAIGDLGTVPTVEEVCKFRHAANRFTRAERPPHEKRKAMSMKAIERMEWEIGAAKAPMLCEIVRGGGK